MLSFNRYSYDYKCMYSNTCSSHYYPSNHSRLKSGTNKVLASLLLEIKSDTVKSKLGQVGFHK